MDYGINDIYNEYINSKEEVDEVLFKSICKDFNINIMDYILDGKEFNMGSNLSTISIIRLPRNNSNPRIDWGESNKYKKELINKGEELFNKNTGEGNKWYIYFTDNEYCRFYWKKSKCRVPNKSAYKFTPTRGEKGNKEKLINLLRIDELAYLKFKKN